MAMPNWMLSISRCRRCGSLRWAGLISRLATMPVSLERVSMMLPSSRSILRLTRYSGAKASLICSKGLIMGLHLAKTCSD
ncbi:hypothetical protein D3C76_1612760 [compost metagenome]